MSLRATAPCWFPPGYPESQKRAERVVRSAVAFLPPCYHPAWGGLIWVPQMCTQAPKFVVIHAEPPRRGPALSRAWPGTPQNGWFWPAPQAHMEPFRWLQAAPRPPEEPYSVYISAPGEKRRTAYVAKPGSSAVPIGAKRPLAASSSLPVHVPEPGSRPPKARTWSGMVPKTTSTIPSKRIASSPASQGFNKPIVSKECEGKVPSVVRQRYLSLFIEECLKFCSSNQEATEKALNEEKVAYDCSPSKRIYVDVAASTLRRLRGLVPSAAPSANSATLYRRLGRYLLTEDQLKENGYPFPHPERPGGAILFKGQEKLPKDASCRICCRCGTKYPVLPSGLSAGDQECRYHWGRLRPAEAAGGWETRYICCAEALGSAGCQVAKRHVQDGRKENLQGFVTTPERARSHPAQPGVYALDCEMSYTTLGLELTRVTVVDPEMRVVYDTFVKPDNEIVDYNTKFSGVTEADLAHTNVTLRDVQAVLLSLFSADTILIGHSLESDLLTLKVIHCTVVDTSVLFPHHLGLPFKRSLRNLMADYLHKVIQDDVRGHNSQEDASSCMSLVLWKIEEDTKASNESGPTPARLS
ncbi:putative exonuclease GOR [Lepus europaeus]|uniref:putative exonuclease GOR n=1 Tax=Lepus europaeus TaxID=9983 RepID=UPI002B4A7975|nr:putative exonuclease GOR [Lepus europaeus]